MHSTRPGASAPGKLMVAGEYAVLDGGGALVMAVDRRARAVWSVAAQDGSRAPGDGSPDGGPPGPEALLAREKAESACGPVPETLHIDVTPLRRSDRKLGLGSSAASAAAAVGAVFAWHGRDPAAPENRGAVLDLALAGHRAVSPRGSGADVAAGVLGGLLRFRRDPTSLHVETDALPMPEAVTLRVVWTGAEARTSDLVARVNALPAPTRRAAYDRIDAAAAALGDGLAGGDVPATLAAVAAHHRAMADLGDAAGAPIVEARLAAIADLAARHGGASKPSGAGGGDVALAFFPADADLDAFDAACAAAGFVPLDLALDPDGVRAEPPAAPAGTA